jgi:hypothetical protein
MLSDQAVSHLRVQALETEIRRLASRIPKAAPASSGFIGYLEDVQEIASGTALQGWATSDVSNYVSGSAKGVILQCKIEIDDIDDCVQTIDFRRDEGGITFYGLAVRTRAAENDYWNLVAQVFVPLTDTKRFDYQVTSTTATPPDAWEITLIGYHE